MTSGRFKLLVANREGVFCFVLLGTHEECEAHLARNDFRTETRIVELDHSAEAHSNSVFAAVYASYTREQWEKLPEYMRRGTKEKPEVLGMDGDTPRFAPIIFKPAR